MKEPITDLNFTKVLQELIDWARENEIKEKDLAMACQVFLIIYETNEAYGVFPFSQKPLKIDELPKTMDCHQKSNLDLKAY